MSVQGGVRIGHPLLSQLPPDENQVHSRIERSGAEQGVAGDQIVEAVALHRPQGIGGQWRLELKDPGGAALTEQLIDLGIVQLQRGHVGPGTVHGFDHRHGVVNHGQGLEAEHVHLEHADLLQRAHLVLGDDGLVTLGRGAATRS